MFCLAMVFMGIYFAGLEANIGAISPNYSDAITTIAHLSCVIIEIVVGTLSTNVS